MRTIPAMIRALLFGLVVLVSALTTQNALAYRWYAKWASTGVTYRFAVNIPASWYSGLDTAAGLWTSVTPSPFTLSRNAGSVNLLRYQNIDGAGGYAGLTSPSYSGLGGVITSFQITFDSSDNFYVSGFGPSGAQWDMQSVAAHELGHALGLCHPTDGACLQPVAVGCGGIAQPTMCSFGKGTIDPRSLESDDRSGLNFLYP